MTSLKKLFLFVALISCISFNQAFAAFGFDDSFGFTDLFKGGAFRTQPDQERSTLPGNPKAKYVGGYYSNGTQEQTYTKSKKSTLKEKKTKTRSSKNSGSYEAVYYQEKLKDDQSRITRVVTARGNKRSLSQTTPYIVSTGQVAQKLAELTKEDTAESKKYVSSLDTKDSKKSKAKKSKNDKRASKKARKAKKSKKDKRSTKKARKAKKSKTDKRSTKKARKAKKSKKDKRSTKKARKAKKSKKDKRSAKKARKAKKSKKDKRASKKARKAKKSKKDKRASKKSRRKDVGKKGKSKKSRKAKRKNHKKAKKQKKPKRSKSLKKKKGKKAKKTKRGKRKQFKKSKITKTKESKNPKRSNKVTKPPLTEALKDERVFKSKGQAWNGQYTLNNKGCIIRQKDFILLAANGSATRSKTIHFGKGANLNGHIFKNDFDLTSDMTPAEFRKALSKEFKITSAIVY